jgi:methylmalonyl-CoA carboxyltransferase 12S subunit
MTETATIPQEVIEILEDLRFQLAALSARVASLEQLPVIPAAAAPAAAAPAPQAEPAAPVRESITEEELLAISGALAAYLGVRVHIRQIRLISSRAWASEGRVSIQASHRLHS